MWFLQFLRRPVFLEPLSADAPEIDPGNAPACGQQYDDGYKECQTAKNPHGIHPRNTGVTS
jgi:hypothetical protein